MFGLLEKHSQSDFESMTTTNETEATYDDRFYRGAIKQKWQKQSNGL